MLPSFTKLPTMASKEFDIGYYTRCYWVLSQRAAINRNMLYLRYQDGFSVLLDIAAQEKNPIKKHFSEPCWFSISSALQPRFVYCDRERGARSSPFSFSNALKCTLSRRIKNHLSRRPTLKQWKKRTELQPLGCI